MGIGSLLNVAASGLAGSAYALDVTGQNVSNVNTPGFARRTPDLSSSITGGVLAGNATRVFDQFSAARMLVTEGGSSSADARDSALGGVQALFDDVNGGGIGDSMSQLFSSFSALAASPDDPTARAGVLSAADSFASRMREMSGSLAQQKTDLASQASDVATQVNGITAQIASLNTAISRAKASGADAGGLEDQRDTLVSNLSQQVDTKVVTDATGQVTILGAGTALVSGGTAATLSVDLDASGAIQVKAGIGGGAGQDVTKSVSGGKLSGIITARDTDLASIASKLDTLATDVANAVNTQHAAGYGADGVNGRPLFSINPGAGAAGSLALDANMIGHPERVAAAANAAANPGDGGNGTALSQLSSALVANGGTQTAADAYGSIVGTVGVLKQSSAREASVQSGLASQAKAMNDSASGVSLDEEMANLSKYQRAYEANARVLQTASDLLASLMQQTA